MSCIISFLSSMSSGGYLLAGQIRDKNPLKNGKQKNLFAARKIGTMITHHYGYLPGLHVEHIQDDAGAGN